MSRTPSAGSLLVDIAVFAGTVVAAIAFDWETRELVWGLWLSSLVIGYATIVSSIGRQYWFTRELAVKGEITHPVMRVVARGLTIFVGLFAFAFFSVHFGGFHLGHGAFLNALFPVVPAAEDNPFSYIGGFGAIVAIGWPMVLATAVASREDLMASGDQHLMKPYLNVVRMHLLIFVFAGAAAVKMDQTWLYVLVLFVYFFPMRSTWALLTRR